MRILLFLLLLPFALTAQTRPKVLVVSPRAVSLNSHVVRVLNANKMKPDSLVTVARSTFSSMAKPILSDFTVYVTGMDDTLMLKPDLVDRSIFVKVKKKNFLTKKEYFANKKVKYKGVQIGPGEKLALEDISKTFAYDYVVFVTLFEVKNEKGINLALKPLSVFGIHYEVYDKNLVFKTGNYVQDALSVSQGMNPKVLFHYVNLSAENVFRAMSGTIN